MPESASAARQQLGRFQGVAGGAAGSATPGHGARRGRLRAGIPVRESGSRCEKECKCVCVCERERERERKRESKREGKRENETENERERETE